LTKDTSTPITNAQTKQYTFFKSNFQFTVLSLPYVTFSLELIF